MSGAADEGRWHYRRSLESRVILLTTIAVGLAVAFVAASAFVTVRVQLQSTLDESLRDRAAQTVDSSAVIQFPSGNEIPAWALVATDLRIALVFSDATIYQPDRMDDFPKLGEAELDVARGTSESSIRTARAVDGVDYRIVSVPYADGEALVIAQSLEAQQQVLTKLGIVLLFFGLVGVIAAGIAGWAVARNGLRPVRKLTSTVEEIARTEDLTPLAVEGDDEVARLATAFNQMLTALDASRERQRRLVTDAGHELRTPLTSLRTNVDLLTQADEAGQVLAPESRTELLGDIRGQIDELTTLIGDLTELARDEPLAQVVGTVDLSEIVDQAVARVRRRAVDVTFDVQVQPWAVIGEAGSLERAVTNLLDNAAKWSPPGGRITVRLADGVLTVDDQGPGIAEADRPRIFDRFWRSEESRAMPGSGLGLSIVRQVAVRHSGTAVAAAAPGGGARLVLMLPGSPDE